MFEFMRNKNNDKSLHCNAVISCDEDLEIFQNKGEFCDAIRVGEALASDSYGNVFPALSTLFHAVKNSDYFTEIEDDFKSQSAC